jgi:hypothetical protein
VAMSREPRPATRTGRSRIPWAGVLLASTLALNLSPASSAPAPAPPPTSTPPEDSPVPAPAPARQVTVFGVVATPHDRRTDPKLAKVEAQLRKLEPGHGFRLMDVQSKRLTTGRSVDCDLGDGYTARVRLRRPADDNGKVQLRCTVSRGRDLLLETVVTTPPNQLFFCDKALDNGTRLLIGIGAR